MPNHCYTAVAFAPEATIIDFTVDFNPQAWESKVDQVPNDPKVINNRFQTQTDIDLALCDSTISENSISVDNDFVNNAASTNDRVVGVAITGASIFTGTSELQYDALYPKAYGDLREPEAMKLDICLGSSEIDRTYHYYTYSPCIHDSALAADDSKLCTAITACRSNKLNFMITGYSASSIGPGAAIVGIAKDGHIIVGPYKAPGKLWQPCDVDACNGAFFEDKDAGEGGIYMYAMTMFHPYTIGCWGPANRPNIKASCST